MVGRALDVGVFLFIFRVGYFDFALDVDPVIVVTVFVFNALTALTIFDLPNGIESCPPALIPIGKWMYMPNYAGGGKVSDGGWGGKGGGVP